jgi:DNA-binding response OmpR family regulator
VANVLVIDDELEIQDLLVQMLSNEGHTVFSASDGNQGLDVVHTKQIDIVITDIVMPEKGGIETIIDMHKEYPGIKILPMSGRINMELDVFTNLCNYFGAAQGLAKPFGREELLKAVNSLLDDDEE